MRTSSSDPNGPTRVVVVDDRPIVRTALVDLFNSAPGLTVTGQAASVGEALALVASAPPHVAIVDLSLGTENGLDLVVALVERFPHVKVLVLSGHDEELYAGRVLKAGALGYIKKDQAPAELIAAVRRVANGKTYVSADAADRILSTLGTSRRPAHARSATDRLSDRERHVLTLMGKGLGTRDIAGQLGLSVKTIETHYAHLKDKLGARTGRELMRLAVGWADDGLRLSASQRAVPASQ